MRLATKLTLQVLLVSLVITPGLAWMDYNRARVALEENIQATGLRATRQTMELVDRTLSKANQDLQSLASDGDVRWHLQRASERSVAAYSQKDRAAATSSLARKALLTGPW